MSNQTGDGVTKGSDGSSGSGTVGASSGRVRPVATSSPPASKIDAEQESIGRFYRATRTNAEERERFKRHRRQIESIDRVSPVVLVLAGVVLGLAAYLSQTPYSTMYLGADLAALALATFFAVLLFVRLLYSVATWRSRLDSERVAAYELRRAMDAFADGSDFDADEVVSRLAEVREFLGYATVHDLLAPRHATALSKYVTQIENASDRRASLEETFPTVAGVAVVAFATPDRPAIRDQSTSVSTDGTGSDSGTTIHRDVRLLVDYLLSHRIAVIAAALALGSVVAFFYGLWPGATAGLGALVAYAGVRNLRS